MLSVSWNRKSSKQLLSLKAMKGGPKARLFAFKLPVRSQHHFHPGKNAVPLVQWKPCKTSAPTKAAR